MKRDAKVGLAVVLVVCVSLAVVFGRQLASGPVTEPTIADAGQELDVVDSLDSGGGTGVDEAGAAEPVVAAEPAIPIDEEGLEETLPEPEVRPTASTTAIEPAATEAPAAAAEPEVQPASEAVEIDRPDPEGLEPVDDEAAVAPSDDDFRLDREQATFDGGEETALVDVPGPAVAETLEPVAPAAPEAPAPAADSVEYTIATGDSLWKIARRFYGKGDDWDRIARANGLTHGSMLSVGSKLTIPGVKGAAGTAASPAPAPRAEAPAAADTRDYVVKGGDSFWKIAAKELGKGTRYVEIEKLNPGVSSSTLRVGQKIVIPEK